MKKILGAILTISLMSGFALADGSAGGGNVHKASFTKTNETGGYIPAGYLDKVIVGVASSNGVLTIYNSTYTLTPGTGTPSIGASVAIASITLGTIGVYNFDDTVVRGIFYVTTNNANGVTIVYRN